MEKEKKNIFSRIVHSTLMRKYSMLVALVLLFILGSLISPMFLTADNIMNLLKQYSIIGLVCLGVTFVTIANVRDLSVGSIVSFVGVISITLQGSMGIFPATIIAICAGLLVGLLNGGLVALTKADVGDTFIMSFGMLSFVSAIGLIISQGHVLSGSTSAAYNFLGDGSIGMVPMPIIIFLVFTVILHIFLSYTKTGRNIYYIGADITVARLSGVKVDKLRILTYLISAGMSAIAAIILTGRIKSATGTMGEGYEMDALTAIAIGGVSLYGGSGTILNTVIGVFIIGVVSNIMSMLGIPTQAQMVTKGVIIIIAICVEKLKRNSKSF